MFNTVISWEELQYHYQRKIKNIEAKGIERTSTHMGMHLIGIHAVALCRLQHGITTGLIDTVGLV